MLIRIDENTIKEFPDDLAALILADPTSQDENINFTIEDVNILIHGIFGTHYDLSLTYEKNIERVREIYLSFGAPNPNAYDSACKAIESYNKEINLEDIGLVDRDELLPTAKYISGKK